ncbi:MAG: hypothetical protein U0797_15320 [Gemmataceae bacterium]
MLPLLDAGGRGVEVTFDLYCYLAGSSILGMYAGRRPCRRAASMPQWPASATRRCGRSCRRRSRP